jgi:hypothetical protein
VKNALVVVFLLIVGGALALHFGSARPGGPDDGLLHLAGATAFLTDSGYPIVQRPPLYAVLLTVLARLVSVPLDPVAPVAQELGSIDFFSVADGLVQPHFLRLVLVVQIVMWVSSVGLLVGALRTLEVRGRWIIFALTMSLLPSSWQLVGNVLETTLSQLLAVAAVFALIICFRAAPRVHWSAAVTAGTALAALGLTHSIFQLLAPVIVFGVVLLMWSHRRAMLTLVGVLMACWLIVVGGWSLHNYTQRGFLGVSGVGGVALSTRTAFYMERAADVYPVEAAIFVPIRDQAFLDEPLKPDVVYWGARASNWLMSERGLTYIEANQMLAGYNLAAITAAPLNYLEAVMSSLVQFHFPAVSAEFAIVPRLVWSAFEVSVTVGFLFSTALWFAVTALRRLGIVAVDWSIQDRVIALLLVIYAYTAVIACAVDVGKPEQRMAVQFIIPMIIVLVGWRIAVLTRVQDQRFILQNHSAEAVFRSPESESSTPVYNHVSVKG